MDLSEQECRRRFAAARVARLATVGTDGTPHLVPVTFALAGDQVVTAVDHKPKRTAALRRLANIAANPRVSLLVDQYTDNWHGLWWVRADGQARIVDTPGGERSAAIRHLTAKYDQYRAAVPAGPVILVQIERWRGWAYADRGVSRAADPAAATDAVPDRPAQVQIGVIGPGAGEATPAQYELARQVGNLLAHTGARVVCGGRGGVMEGVALGVQEAGGLCVGILPGHDRTAANRYLGAAICSGVGEKRNEMVVESSDAILVIGSNAGTVIEVLLAKKNGVPVFGLDFAPVATGGRRLDAVVIVDDPAEAVTRAFETARARAHTRLHPE
ncbi:TIGR00725 family protein/PPOX class probable F420-dependent enzyme, Rv0121 family [Parafrankia irregularis]|uniref:TIGR00725 family protein/PPOX class probable F420-dependent enzyme, Rv0121 family n=1 Tax=Parafrankia irregularis TaxID=795642 RepID=A0A0S4QYV4_9ACTN|nr:MULTISPECIES: TIGR03668 family PPOX class F420-dependent oxidoreductase [Parafrankia]MBE3201429.1 TIGR03668 family PPOX class F420-dependent oxidoreductase [Parafrankia sp. CH37]CUU60302.1 TIGR00725 family protein/PPOX class probable F420-dependent enzyme, Rv0121 family [Parafrankia irregularis]